MTDELIKGHRYMGEDGIGAPCQFGNPDSFTRDAHTELCGRQADEHADPGPSEQRHLINTHPHDFVPQANEPTLCDYGIDLPVPGLPGVPGELRVCGYPEQLHKWAEHDRYMEGKRKMKDLVRQADAAQYERPPMPDAARKGPVVTLIDGPVDPLGTMAVIGGIYKGVVARSKAEVTDQERRAMLADMQATVLNGPLESILFTFLVEGVPRDITHQMVRNRFAFYAQESLRFAVAEDWAQEVPLPPSLAPLPQDHPAVGVWRKALNGAEDAYNALIGAGMPAEEARKVLPHAITTRLYWTVSLRTLLAEAGKRTCTQAQFDWRIIFAGVAKALRERGVQELRPGYDDARLDEWQYEALADLMRPVCYQQGKCGFMAKFDRGCTIRARVDQNAEAGVPSTEWGTDHVVRAGVDDVYTIKAIDPAEWAADPAAARVVGE